MNGCHWGAWYVRMSFHGNRSFCVVLTDVFVHLLDRQWMTILLIDNRIALNDFFLRIRIIFKELYYLVMTGKPQTRRLVIFVVGNVQIVRPRLDDFATELARFGGRWFTFRNCFHLCLENI